MQHHFFVVRPTAATKRGRILHLLPTCTWTAYNDFGGANSYFGTHGPNNNEMGPVLSLQRPWTRGLVKLRVGKPSRISAFSSTKRMDWSSSTIQIGFISVHHLLSCASRLSLFKARESKF